MGAIIVSGHGQFSIGLIDAFSMIFGENEKVVAIPFLSGEGIPQLQEKFKEQMAQFGEEESVLFLVDIFGGTPYNSATQLIYGMDNCDVVSGVNLPMLLEVASMKDILDLKGLTELAVSTSQSSCKVFSETIKSVQSDNKNDEDEDDLL